MAAKLSVDIVEMQLITSLAGYFYRDQFLKSQQKRSGADGWAYSDTTDGVEVWKYSQY